MEKLFIIAVETSTPSMLTNSSANPAGLVPVDSGYETNSYASPEQNEAENNNVVDDEFGATRRSKTRLTHRRAIRCRITCSS